MRSLTFLIPGLTWSLDSLHMDDSLRFPVLETMLARSKKYQVELITFYSQLCYLFGLESEQGCDLPLAALSRLVDDADRPEGMWMRADPIHLEMGRESLRLMDFTTFSLTQTDAIVAATLLKDLFDDYGWEFEIPDASRWYLKLNETPQVNTTEVNAVRGKDVQLLMPQGEFKSKLERLMTEVQMVLHDSDFNLQRERSGELPVNSLWFWGCGVLPEILPRRWSKLLSNDPVAQGLAILSGTPFELLKNWSPEFIPAADSPGECLIVLDDLQAKASYEDVLGWKEILSRLERDFFSPLMRALKQSELDKLVIITESREFEVSKSTLNKFWIRRKPLWTHI